MSSVSRIGLAATVLLAAAGALIANRAAPDSRTVGVERARGSLTIPRPDGADPASPRAWRMQLDIDPDIRQPGPEWVLREGQAPGAGYELAWNPAAMSLFLQRGQDDLMLLGIARLMRPPREVVFARRGSSLAVLVDGRQVIDALDPQGVPEPGSGPFPDGWSLAATGNLGASTLTVQDDGGLPPVWASDVPPGDDERLAAEASRGPLDEGERDRSGFSRRVLAVRGWTPPEVPGRADHALLRVRQALTARASRDPDLARRMLGEAARAVAALGAGHPDHARLRLWLAWAEVRFTLDQAGQDGAGLVAPAIDQLAVLVGERVRSEGPGMLIAVLPELAERAVRRPTVPRPLDQVLAERAAWLAVLDRCAKAAVEALGGGDTPLALQLRFLSHAAGTLSGRQAGPDSPRPLPTPADAPDWLAVRWRALAGADPGQSILPPPPASAVTSDPVLPAIQRLVQAAALEPLAAVRLRACLAETDEASRIASSATTGRETATARLEAARLRAERATEAAPSREALLSRLILSLRDLADSPPGPERRDAIQRVEADAGRLGQVRADSSPRPDAPVMSDPLAFALACLAASRIQRAEPQGPSGDLRAAAGFAPPDLDVRFASLAPYARLLVRRPGHPGDPGATDLIWLHDDAILPPAQALAAALAMQEVAYERSRSSALPADGLASPDWSLLQRLPAYTLPLDLLDPAPRERSGAAGTPAP